MAKYPIPREFKNTIYLISRKFRTDFVIYSRHNYSLTQKKEPFARLFIISVCKLVGYDTLSKSFRIYIPKLVSVSPKPSFSLISLLIL